MSLFTSDFFIGYAVGIFVALLLGEIGLPPFGRRGGSR